LFLPARTGVVLIEVLNARFANFLHSADIDVRKFIQVDAGFAHAVHAWTNGAEPGVRLPCRLPKPKRRGTASNHPCSQNR
jgi:hypothetical protein